ncbi:tumor necrosis factor receptor superfamily member 5 [Aulostomus maculatus]
MATMNCNSESKYSKDGSCCDRCPAGTYVKAHCDGEKQTQCVICEHGRYTATNNHMTECHVCKNCSPNNNQKKETDCTAKEDTVCECVRGFYCSTTDCEHCQSVTHCPPGAGVKVEATRTNDTICGPCAVGTFSNVSDFHSPCKTHTSCDDLGRVLITRGTSKTDNICGDFKPNCHWLLPAGLWSGFILTAILVFLLICLMTKRKSYKAASSSSPVTLSMVSAAPARSMELSLPSPELNGNCHGTCGEDGYTFPLFVPAFSCGTEDSVDGSHPNTPLKASISFNESNNINGNAGHDHSINLFQTCSEPQEDEWCGT